MTANNSASKVNALSINGNGKILFYKTFLSKKKVPPQPAWPKLCKPASSLLTLTQLRFTKAV